MSLASVQRRQIQSVQEKRKRNRSENLCCNRKSWMVLYAYLSPSAGIEMQWCIALEIPSYNMLQIKCKLSVMLVCPGWPPDVSVCWAHGLFSVVDAMCSHAYCLSPPILFPFYCFSGSTCVPLVTLVSLPTYPPGVCIPVLIRCSPLGWFLFIFVLFYY